MDKIELFAFKSFYYNNYWEEIDTLNFANLENGRIFSHMMSIDISGDSFEVPVFAKEIAFSAKSKGYDEIVIPLFNNSSFGLISKKLTGSILDSFRNINSVSRLAGVKSSKGNIYYGCQGLILDENFSPLLMLTVRINYDVNNPYIDKCFCRIPQSIISRQDELLPKAIYKKIIPIYCTTPLEDVRLSTVLQHHLYGQKVEIILHAPTNIIVSPVLPTPAGVSDDVFDRILKEELTENDH